MRDLRDPRPFPPRPRPAALLLLLPLAALAIALPAPRARATAETSLLPGAPAPLELLDRYETAREDAVSRGVPLGVFFTAAWSAHANRLLSEASADEGARARLSRLALHLATDGELGRALRDRHGVREFPTFLLLTSDGVEIGRIGGAPPIGEWLSKFDELIKKTPKR